MIKIKDRDFFVSDWLRNANTLEFLAAWKSLNNENFNYGEFAIIRNQSCTNSYKISVKERRDTNMDKHLVGENIRDSTSINELLILANLESLNSILIQGNVSKNNRFNALKQTAENQFASLDKNDKLKFVKKTSDDVYINPKGLQHIEKKTTKNNYLGCQKEAKRLKNELNI
jgi:hypothetical protein